MTAEIVKIGERDYAYTCSILYLSTSIEATVEITEARLAGESDAKNLDKWKFKRFAVGFCGSATPILLLSALAVGDAAWDISYNYNLDPTFCCLLFCKVFRTALRISIETSLG